MKLSVGITYPKWVVIQLVEKCNLRCRMCYEWGETGSYHNKKNLTSLDYSVVRRVIKDCLPGKPYFGLFGGEPLLYPQIGDVIKLIKEGGCRIDIPTNGTLVEKYAELLVETQPNRLWISLDGPEEVNDKQRGKGVFQKVISGIEKLYEIRRIRQSDLPKIGVTYIVTPLTYCYIEEFFLSCLDLSKIDHLSIEFQCYATEEQYKRHREILKNEFSIFSVPIAKGIIQEPATFADMDFELIVQQMVKVREVCQKLGIYFIAYPKTIELNNVQNFFTARWSEMIDKKSLCAFPWIYIEISARGDVTVCHTFYDLSIGNVYKANILDIWKGERIKQVRKYLRKELFPICTACARYYADPNKH